MKRNCSLDEISDGKLYGPEELVEASCNGCNGSASCCHGMGNTIILDPYDVWRLTISLGCSFEELLSDKIELHVVDGIILPNLRMNGSYEGCTFLNSQGRCSIHTFRPGICRIFPLGRYYEDHRFHYFLQKNECSHLSRTKVKVSKWVDTPDLKQNEQFLIDWHYFLNDVEKLIKGAGDETIVKNINMYLLGSFYIKKYQEIIDFYTQFKERLREATELLKQIG